MKKHARTLGTILRTGAVALVAAGAGLAHAGHTNAVLEAQLDGRAEVGPGKRIAGDPNGRGEAYVFGIDNDPYTLCYVLTVDKIQLVPVAQGMMAHIHEGAAGTNGPIVANLAGPEDGNAADCLTEDEPGKFPTGESGIVQRILGNPSGFYVNVHNPQYPNGAIRGQLAYEREYGHKH